MKKNIFIISSILILFLSSNVMSSQYRFLELGTFGGNASYAYDINNIGHVVGLAYVNSYEDHPFLFDGETMRDLGTLDGYYNSAYGINEEDYVVGYTYVSNRAHAFLYHNYNMVDIHEYFEYFGGIWSYAEDINNSKEIVGFSNSSAILIKNNGIFYNLGTLGGATSRAYAINDCGYVVGEADNVDGDTHAFLYAYEKMIDLGTLGGDESIAYDINDAGVVVGYSESYPYNRARAFLYDGTMHNLGTLGGYKSYAYGINNSGVVVGWADDSEYDRCAFVYDNEGMHNLNELTNLPAGWRLVTAYAINDYGDIVGYGTNSDGYTRGFVLYNNYADRTIIPEPMTLCLLGIAISQLIRKKIHK